MKLKPWLLFLVIIGLLNLNSCSDPNAAKRQILLSELQEADSNHTLLSQEVSGRKSKVAFLEQRLIEQKSELAEFKGRVKAYMMNHKMAIAAIAAGLGGGAVAIDPDNEFSDDAQMIGGLGLAIASLWASENWEEVKQVADQLTQADAHVKSLESQISSTSNALQGESDHLSQEEMELNALQQKVTQIRSELSTLG